MSTVSGEYVKASTFLWYLGAALAGEADGARSRHAAVLPGSLKLRTFHKGLLEFETNNHAEALDIALPRRSFVYSRVTDCDPVQRRKYLLFAFCTLITVLNTACFALLERHGV